MIGVYEIWVGPYYYQGSSKNMKTRCEAHLRSLKSGKHDNAKMQNAYNKYKTFEWQVLLECDDRDVAYAYEQDYIDANFGLRYYLNLNDVASKPPPGWGREPYNKGKTLPKEQREKMSLARTGKKRGPTGKPAWNKGLKASDEARAKLSKAGKGRVPWNKGKKMEKKSASV